MLYRMPSVFRIRRYDIPWWSYSGFDDRNWIFVSILKGASDRKPSEYVVVGEDGYLDCWVDGCYVIREGGSWYYGFVRSKPSKIPVDKFVSLVERKVKCVVDDVSDFNRILTHLLLESPRFHIFYALPLWLVISRSGITRLMYVKSIIPFFRNSEDYVLLGEIGGKGVIFCRDFILHDIENYKVLYEWKQTLKRAWISYLTSIPLLALSDAGSEEEERYVYSLLSIPSSSLSTSLSLNCAERRDEEVEMFIQWVQSYSRSGIPKLNMIKELWQKVKPKLKLVKVLEKRIRGSCIISTTVPQEGEYVVYIRCVKGNRVVEDFRFVKSKEVEIKRKKYLIVVFRLKKKFTKYKCRFEFYHVC